jgi:glycosyltransferase involved in cell wall biosynthesis
MNAPLPSTPAPARAPRASITALLGRQDQPTDAIRDYCACLARALPSVGISSTTTSFPWDTLGWPRALRDLCSQSSVWHGQWVHIHYTALAWSARGFPSRIPRILRILRLAGVRTAVVFHDSLPSSGNRLRDRARRTFQLRIMRRAYRLSDFSIFTVPLERIPWLPRHPAHALFIPIGSNLPDPSKLTLDITKSPALSREPITVAVFGVTGSGQTSAEIADISSAILRASESVSPLRLLVLGRGAAEAEPALRQSLAGSPVTFEVHGILPLEEISRVLVSANLLLFVRGPVSPQRSSALAALCAGLPIVGYRDSSTCFPITEAGLELAPVGDRAALGEALTRVLADPILGASLAARSRAAHSTYFAWDKIAARYAEAFANA